MIQSAVFPGAAVGPTQGALAQGAVEAGVGGLVPLICCLLLDRVCKLSITSLNFMAASRLWQNILGVLLPDLDQDLFRHVLLQYRTNVLCQGSFTILHPRNWMD